MTEPEWLTSLKAKYPDAPREFFMAGHKYHEERRLEEYKMSIINDLNSVDELGDDGYDEPQDESMDPLEESGCTKSISSDDEDDDEEIDELVLEDMQKFEESFRGITKRYRLLNRIGEGVK